jgi:hypothetical protein
MAKSTDIKVIEVLMEEAMENGMEAEVVYGALKAMQEDPTMTPAQAFQIGMEDI